MPMEAWPPRYCEAVAEKKRVRLADIIQNKRLWIMTETHYSSLENNSKSERILSEGWLLKDKRRWRKYKQVCVFFFNSTLQYREHGGKSIVFTNAELIWYLLQFISALVQDEQAKFCPLFFMVADAILLLHMRNQVSSLMCPELNSFYLDHFRDQLVAILLWCVLRIHWVLTYISDLRLTLFSRDNLMQRISVPRSWDAVSPI